MGPFHPQSRPWAVLMPGDRCFGVMSRRRRQWLQHGSRSCPRGAISVQQGAVTSFDFSSVPAGISRARRAAAVSRGMESQGHGKIDKNHHIAKIARRGESGLSLDDGNEPLNSHGALQGPAPVCLPPERADAPAPLCPEPRCTRPAPLTRCTASACTPRGRGR